VVRALKHDPNVFFDKETGELNVYHLAAFVYQEVVKASQAKQTPYLTMPLAQPAFVVTQFPTGQQDASPKQIARGHPSARRVCLLLPVAYRGARAAFLRSARAISRAAYPSRVAFHCRAARARDRCRTTPTTAFAFAAYWSGSARNQSGV
jgi:hypothetical protein